MGPKECPMCGETMQLREREIIDHVPGTAQTRTSKFREWVCPECDYFEEAEEGSRAPSVSSSSLRRPSSISSILSAVSHSSHSTSRTAGRPSSETSTRDSSMWTTCICSVFTRKFWSFPQLGHVSATRVSSLIANIVNSPKAIVGDGICRRNAELLPAAQKSWDLFEFARFEAFLHQNDRSASRVHDPRVYRRAIKNLPQCLQIELDLLAINQPLASGLEFENREGAGSGFNDAIDGAPDDASVHPHREGNFVKHATRPVQDANVFAGAHRLVRLHGCPHGVLQVIEVINLIAAHQPHGDLANWPPISEAGSRLPDPVPLKKPMHKRSDKTFGCGRRLFERASVGFCRHQRSDRDTRRSCVTKRVDRCDPGIRDSPLESLGASRARRGTGFGIRWFGVHGTRIPDRSGIPDATYPMHGA